MQGDSAAAEALHEVLPKLHQIAIRELKRERYVAPLSVWLGFYALASLAMRRVLASQRARWTVVVA
jgi:hypothetical protein